jgi:dTDP-4-dehydrorhamnose reductase
LYRSEPPRPLNEYGRSKLLAEQWVIEAAPSALVVRTNFFGWGHASRRSFTDWIIYTLREGRELAVHGWIYAIADGLLKDLGFTIDSAHATEPIYHLPSVTDEVGF